MTGRLSALVLDDDPTSLSIISETLENFRFRVFPFQTLKEALDFVKHGYAKGVELDMVLVEVNLNNMAPRTSANSDLLHNILNELQVPLITMCSYDDEEAVSECMNLGACFHVMKPLDKRSFNRLWHQALEHKSKKAKPQGTTMNSTENGMVSSSTKKPKHMFVPDPESNGYEEPKKRNRITWTIELHEKFLEAVEALGGSECATPEGILQLMNVKGLNKKHISSHLQKHRLRHRNAKQGGQRQENATTKPISELIISAHDEATFGSITPRVEIDGEVYPLRLWTMMKKRSVDVANLKTDMYTCTSGNYRDDTESVWDKYHKNLQKVFSESNKRLLLTNKHRCPGKNNIIITDEWVPNEAPKTAGEICYGASIKISGSSSLASDQVGENNRAKANRENNTVGSINLLEGYGASIGSSGSSSLLPSYQVGGNNHSEAARANANIGNINLFEGYDAFIGSSGSGSMLTNGQVRQNGHAEAIRDNDNLGIINFSKGCGAFIEISGSSNLLKSNQLGENNRTEFARDNDNMENINLLKGYGASIENSGSRSLLTSHQVGQHNCTEAARYDGTMRNINLLEGIMNPKYVASVDFSVVRAHLESDDLDLTGPFDGWEEADSFWISQLEASQEHQSLGMEDLLQGNDALRSVGLINVDEPVAEGPKEHQNLGLEDPLQVDGNAWNDVSVELFNLLDEPMAEEATVGGSQEQQSLALEDLLQVGDIAWDDDLRSMGMANLLDGEPMAQEAAISDALVDGPMTPVSQGDGLWSWSPQLASEYDMLFGIRISK